ncbi:MAG: ZIP family metal transporter [Oscillospiraceae bacterium]|nr:ZIP family metal transporter [Oscillospiraceae bacterium]
MNIIILSLIAGVAGMGFGSFITTVIGSRSDKMTSIFLAFSGGVMISLGFMELIPDAIEKSNVGVVLIGLFAGAALVYFLHEIVDKITGGNKSKSQESCSCSHESHSHIHESHDEFCELASSVTASDGNSRMLRSGLIMLFAIGLHNIPEGLALGAAGVVNPQLGLTLAVAIGLHNIPAGMAITTPLLIGGLSKFKAIGITLLAGSTTVLGTIVGVLVGGISDVAVAVSFAVAAGALLYVVISETLPQAIAMGKSNLAAIFTFIGIAVGALSIQLLV